MALRRRGFTLMEIIVYTGLFAVVGLLLAQIFALMTSTQQSTASAYAVTGQVDTAIQWLRRDLEDTVLGTVRSYKSPQALTMISARTIDPKNQGQLVISEYGGLRWTKHVCWGVRPRGSLSGDLVRWEVALTGAEADRLPKVMAKPTAIPGDARVMLHNVMLPNKTIEGLAGGKRITEGDWGGFRVEFVRRAGGDKGAESTSESNPALSRNNVDVTRLVEVQLDIKEDNVGAPNFYSIKFRVMPKN